MNEAELQANLLEQLRKALPLLPSNITLEHSLTLKLGHQDIVINGKASNRNSVRGRYDVLVKYNNAPLLLAELKAPHVSICEADIEQARSYAKLHSPIVPLILIANGNETILKRTYDNSDIEPSDVEEHRLKEILSSAIEIAREDSQQAIRVLLGSSQRTWNKIFQNWNSQLINSLSGSASEFGSPIPREFEIPRVAAKEVEKLLENDESVIVLHGPPLSGVTNILTQIVRGSKTPILFLSGEAEANPFQYIANRLSEELAFGINSSDVRTWLNTRGSLNGITFILDGVSCECLGELLDFAERGLLKLVIGADSETYIRKSRIEGRMQFSKLGHLASPIEIGALSDEEFNVALKLFDNNFSTKFYEGAQYSQELRWPRTLRVIVAAYCLVDQCRYLESTNGFQQKIFIPPILLPEILECCYKAIEPNVQVKIDLRKLASAFWVEIKSKNSDFISTVYGRPSIDLDYAEKILGETRITRLISLGFASYYDIRSVGPRLLIRIEEVLAYFISSIWADELEALQTVDDIELGLQQLLTFVDSVPFGDLSIVLAIQISSEKNNMIPGVAIRYLLNSKPTKSSLTEGSIVEMLTSDGLNISIQLGEQVCQEAIGNIQPWNVLSYLIAKPIAVDNMKLLNSFLFKELGSSPLFIYSPRPTKLCKMKSIKMHDIGEGSLPSMSAGVVEPLVQSMLLFMSSYPDELIKIAKLAIKEESIYLAYRVLTVAQIAESSTDEKVAVKAKYTANLLDAWFCEQNLFKI